MQPKPVQKTYWINDQVSNKKWPNILASMRMKARMRKTRTPGSAPPLVHLRAFVLLASAFGGQFLLFQLQLSSGFELHHLLGVDIDVQHGGGVDAPATGTIGHGEGA